MWRTVIAIDSCDSYESLCYTLSCDELWLLLISMVYIKSCNLFFMWWALITIDSCDSFSQSVIARGLLNEISEKSSYVPVFMNFSAQTSSVRSQEMIESKLEKKRKNILGNYILDHMNTLLLICHTLISTRETMHSRPYDSPPFYRLLLL